MAKTAVLKPFLAIAKDKFTINTIEDMIGRRDLALGDVVELNGYYTAGDGAGHKRKIEETDDGSGVRLANGLWGNIVHSGEVNVSWFGAKGDGVADDTIAIQKAIDFSLGFWGCVKLEEKVYMLTKPLYCYGDRLDEDGWGQYATQIKCESGFATLHKTTNALTEGCISSGSSGGINYEVNGYDAILCYTSNNVNKKGVYGVVLKNLKFSHTNPTQNTWSVVRTSGGYDRIENLYFKFGGGLNFVGQWFHNKINLLRGSNRMISMGDTGTSNQIGLILSNYALAEGFDESNKFILKLKGVDSTLSDICLERSEVRFIDFDFARFDISGCDFEPTMVRGCECLKLNNSVVNISQVRCPAPTSDVPLFNLSGSSLTIDSLNVNYAFDSPITNLSKCYNSNLEIIELQTSKTTDSIITIAKLKELNNSIILDKQRDDKSCVSIKNRKAGYEMYSFGTETKRDSSLRAFVGNKEFGKIFKGLTSPTLSDEGVDIQWRPGYSKDDIIFLKSCNENGILGMVAQNNGNQARDSRFDNIPLVQYSSENPLYPKVGSFVINPTTKKLKYFDGSVYQELSSSTTLISLLDTPYHATKMQHEGVYDDFIQYMDQKTEYDRVQRELEQQRGLAFEQSGMENYEEWLAEQPMMLPAKEEPQPSDKLLAFKTKYLG